VTTYLENLEISGHLNAIWWLLVFERQGTSTVTPEIVLLLEDPELSGSLTAVREMSGN